MSRFGEQDSIDPDDPELDYSPLSLSERAAKLGPSASQRARSEPIRPVFLAPKAINEPAKRDLDWRAALLGVAARFAAAAIAVAVVAALFIIMKPASRESIASSTPSDTTGSTPQSNQEDIKSKPGVAELKPLLASPPSQPATHDQSEQSNQGDVKSNPALAELKPLLASPPSEPATHEQSQQLLQRFLQWGEKADSTEASASSAQPQ